MTNLSTERTPALSTDKSKDTLVGFFDTREDAEQAVERLKKAGLMMEAIRFVPGFEADRVDDAVTGDNSFWRKLDGWKISEDERVTYAEGLRRGGFLVSAEVDDAHYETAQDILDVEGAVDLEERAGQWRLDGWDGNLADAASAFSTRQPAETNLDDHRYGTLLPTTNDRESVFPVLESMSEPANGDFRQTGARGTAALQRPFESLNQGDGEEVAGKPSDLTSSEGTNGDARRF